MAEQKTISQLCKQAGLKDANELSRLIGVSYQTFKRWPTTKPDLWRVVLLGAVAVKKDREASNGSRNRSHSAERSDAEWRPS